MNSQPPIRLRIGQCDDISKLQDTHCHRSRTVPSRKPKLLPRFKRAADFHQTSIPPNRICEQVA